MNDTGFSHPLAFKGKGSEYFGIQVPNWILTIVTLGLYYPWAKAESLKYLYQKTEFAGSRFTFHGTGKEMFKGFIKAIAIFVLLYGVLLACMLSDNQRLAFAGIAFFYIALLLLIPVAIHGSMRYRMSRTSWRGIHFSYTGSLKELMLACVKGFLLTLVTIGLYGAWFMVDIRKIIIGNISIGNVRFKFEGTGSELFFIHLKGYFLSVITLGVYLFWYMRDLHLFYINNMAMEQGDNYAKLEADISGFGYFKLLAGNMLIVLFTLGLGMPFATIRTLRFIVSNTEKVGYLDLHAIEQTDRDFVDATMEDVSDILNLDLV